jgi:RHS repeat-associated protein
VAARVGTIVGEDRLSTFSYDGFDRLRFVSPTEGAAPQEFQYDGLGRRVFHKDPDLNSEEQTLVDGFGQMRGYQRNGRGTGYLYDGLGRKTGEVTPDGVYTWEYDGTRPEDVGHVVRESFTSSALGAIGTNSTTYEHGGPDSAVSRVDRVIEGETLSTTLGYDGRGRLRSIGYPALAGQAFAVEYGYNPYGQPETVSEPGGGTVFWRQLEASPFGDTSRSQLGNGIVQLRTPNPVNGLPAAMSAGIEQGSVVVKNDVLRYDYRSLLASRTTQGGPLERFFHDDFGRLHTHQVGTEMRGYSYDPRGNLNGKWDLGALRYEKPLLPTAVTSTDAGHVLDYDAEGRLTVRNEDDDPALRVELDYTEFDLPREIRIGPDNAPTETYTYRYDAGKRRVAEYRNGALSEVQVGELWRRSTRNGTTEFAARLAVPDGTPIEVAVVPGQPRQVRYMLTDHLGSVTHVLDQSGLVDSRSYQPFGEATTLPSGRTTRLGFTGHENDVAGLVNAKGRIYDPEIGRFLTPDPIVHDPFNGQAWNRHSYVLNSPMNLVDLMGLDPSCTSAAPCMLNPITITAGGSGSANETTQQPGSRSVTSSSSSSSSGYASSLSEVGDGSAQSNAALAATLQQGIAIAFQLQQLAIQQMQQSATMLAQLVAQVRAHSKTSSASLAPSASAPPAPPTGQPELSMHNRLVGDFDSAFKRHNDAEWAMWWFITKESTQMISSTKLIGAALPWIGRSIAARSAGELVHFTSAAGAAGIAADGSIVGANGIFAAGRHVLNLPRLAQSLVTGLPAARLTHQVSVTGGAAARLSRVAPIGPFSLLKALGGTHIGAPGALNLATGVLTRSGSMLRPLTLVYGPDLAAYAAGLSTYYGIRE